MINDMKQTAVEWIISKLPMVNDNDPYLAELIEQAKEMQKQQQGYSEEEVFFLLMFFWKEDRPEFKSNPVCVSNWFQKFKKNSTLKKEYRFEDCNISNRLLNCLKAMDLIYLEQLTTIKMSDIKKYRMFGAKSQKELCDLMESYGLKFLGQ
jgi:DNA-directed RNA polymerase alpha subunit